MKLPWVSVAAADRPWVADQVAVLHLQRLRLAVPLLTVVCLIFVGVDLSLLARGANPHQVGVYLGLDLGFLAFHLGLLAWVLRGPARAPLALVVFYASVALAWAVATGAIEYQRTANFTALLLSILGISSLGLFPAPAIAALILGALGAFLAVCSLWPGYAAPDLEKAVSFFALAPSPSP